MRREMCEYCPGHMIPGKTRMTFNKRGLHLTITDIPAFVCDKCGAAEFQPPAMFAMENIRDRVRAGKAPSRPRTIRFTSAV